MTHFRAWGTMITVIVCTAFAAVSATNYMVAHLPHHIGQIYTPEPIGDAILPISNHGEPLAGRNMFCSSCDTSTHSANTGPQNGIQSTSLPITLVAIMVLRPNHRSYATIRNTHNHRQGAYQVGDRIPGVGVIQSIEGAFVDFHNEHLQRTERMTLMAKQQFVRVVFPPQSKQSSTDRKPNRDGIRQVNEYSYEIARESLEQVIANPALIGAGAVPVVKNGNRLGFRVYSVRPQSIAAKAGIRNGDILQRVNGKPLTNLSEALDVYANLKIAKSITVFLIRRGTPVTVNYSIQ